MERAKIHKIIVKQNTYDILSAGTDFYAYMDDSRLYHTFEKLIYEEDRAVFENHAEEIKRDRFVMRMVGLSGELIPCYTYIEPGNADGVIVINLVDIDELLEAEKAISSQLLVENKMLELYGDDLFIYHPGRNEMKLISKFNVAQEDISLTLEEFAERLMRHVPQERQEEISAFVADIRSGNRYFEICVDGNIIDEEKDARFSAIRAASIYEEGVLFAVVGCIRIGQEQTLSGARTVEMDSLTGLLAKSEITNMAIRAIDVEKRNDVSIAIIDIDYFKKVNDTYGHMVGDETLKKVSSIILDEVGNNGVVGRIGGDEFFVLFYDAYDLEVSRERLRSIKNTVSANFPQGDEEHPAITLSIGCAAYPKDADNYSDLFALADFALYRAKDKGRNRYIIYNEEKHGKLEDIRKTVNLATRINSRGDMSKGEILCVIMDKAYSQETYTLDKLLDDYLENFEPQRVTIYDAVKAKVVHMVGEKVPSKAVIEETEKYIMGPFWQKKYVYDDVVVNDISIVEGRDEKAYEMMKKQGILSCIHIKFLDRGGNRCILSLESVSKRITWNKDHMHYYKLMAKVLSEYSIVEKE
ncbi:MAG: GGDEF domain-containing protein [Lachnospiraceae bacterium]|nr:GGDEF domain-containing protein [Lachnospiraceae bacterium]